MVNKYFLFTIFLVFFLSACGTDASDNDVTPTPFPVQAPPQRITTAAPIPISLQNLAANPDFYVGATLQLSGQFRRLPILACDGRPFPSPATWGLEDSGFLANASGMDAQLRSLLDENQPITVEGRWLKYEGPVGCEAHVQDQTIWYLSTDRVLDPHPLVRVQASPVSGETVQDEIAAGPGATMEPTAQVVLSETPPPGLTATAVPSTTPIIAEATTIITATASFTATPLITATAGFGTPTVTASQTPAGTPAGSPTPTIEGAATATITATPGASATPSNATAVDKGELNAEDLIISNLGAGTTDRWTLDLAAGDSITITVAPATATDIVLSLFDSNNVALVNERNAASVGAPETITNFNINSPGIHTVQIKTVQGIETDYALMFMDADSYSFIFRGRLTPNAPQNGNVEADTDHFWFFNASSGDSVSFTITPNDNGDPYVELYDPSGSRILTIDDTGSGEVESLNNYTLLDSGMYGIRVAEFDFQRMSYTVELLP